MATCPNCNFQNAHEGSLCSMCDTPLLTSKTFLREAWNAVFATKNDSETSLPQWMQCSQCRQWRTTLVAIDAIPEWTPCKTWQCSQNNIAPTQCNQAQKPPTLKTHPLCVVFALELQRRISSLKLSAQAHVKEVQVQDMRTFLKVFPRKYQRVQAAQAEAKAAAGVLAAETKKKTASSSAMDVEQDNNEDQGENRERQNPAETVGNDENVNLINHGTHHDNMHAAAAAQPQSKSAEWECSVCTFVNTHIGNRCAMCDTPKPGSAAENTTDEEFARKLQESFNVAPTAAAAATNPPPQPSQAQHTSVAFPEVSPDFDGNVPVIPLAIRARMPPGIEIGPFGAITGLRAGNQRVYLAIGHDDELTWTSVAPSSTQTWVAQRCPWYVRLAQMNAKQRAELEYAFMRSREQRGEWNFDDDDVQVIGVSHNGNGHSHHGNGHSHTHHNGNGSSARSDKSDSIEFLSEKLARSLQADEKLARSLQDVISIANDTRHLTAASSASLWGRSGGVGQPEAEKEQFHFVYEGMYGYRDDGDANDKDDNDDDDTKRSALALAAMESGGMHHMHGHPDAESAADGVELSSMLNQGLKQNEVELIDDRKECPGLTITLFDHQRKGVAWMLDMEGNRKYKGGFLCDQMGVGKTIQIIGLMLASRHKAREKKRKEYAENNGMAIDEEEDEDTEDSQDETLNGFVVNDEDDVVFQSDADATEEDDDEDEEEFRNKNKNKKRKAKPKPKAKKKQKHEKKKKEKLSSSAVQANGMELTDDGDEEEDDGYLSVDLGSPPKNSNTNTNSNAEAPREARSRSAKLNRKRKFSEMDTETSTEETDYEKRRNSKTKKSENSKKKKKNSDSEFHLSDVDDEATIDEDDDDDSEEYIPQRKLKSSSSRSSKAQTKLDDFFGNGRNQKRRKLSAGKNAGTKSLHSFESWMKHKNTNKPSQAKPWLNVRPRTLIVGPLAIIDQWKDEINDRAKGAFKVAVYHGGNRKTRFNRHKLREYDVVVTTYGHVTSEFAKGDEEKQSGLFSLPSKFFHRVVLDEAHIIKNHNSHQAKACAEIGNKGVRARWCLTGTPIQNKLMDLFSLSRFLQIPFCATQKDFKNMLALRTQGRNTVVSGQSKVRVTAFLAAHMLRRLKSEVIDDLVSKTEQVIELQFDAAEKDIYEAYQNHARSKFNKFVKAGTAKKNYAHILVLLLRLRQISDHPYLAMKVQDGHSEAVADENGSGDGDKEEKEYVDDGSDPLEGVDAAIIKRLNERDQGILDSECPICMDIFSNGVMFDTCGHLYCAEHLYAIEPAGKCPECRTSFDPERAIPFTVICRSELVDAKHKTSMVNDGMVMNGDMIAQKMGGGNDDGDGTPVVALPRRIVWCKKSKAKGIYRSQDDIEEEEKEAAQQEQSKEEKLKKLQQTFEWNTFEVDEELKMEFDDDTEQGYGEEDKYPNAAGWDFCPSSKTKMITQKLQWIRKHRPNDKIIVFSQFTTMLDILTRVLRKHKIGFMQYHGGHKREQRKQILDAFKKDAQRNEIPVLLMSLKCAALGLNLTVANHVMFADLWWNPATEQQAIDRVHRIGQTKHVFITKMVIKESVEERMLALQRDKQNVADSALDGANFAKQNRLTVADLARLFGSDERVVQEAQQQDASAAIGFSRDSLMNVRRRT